ncbi:ribonuclease III [Thermodesulfobacteriota bacterium]
MNLTKLEKKIGHDFKNKDLLLTALTHKSYSYESNGQVEYDNEKLEFLGDSVLSLVVSDMIYKRNPDYSEGDLSKLRASVVDEYSLALIAGKLGVGKFLLLGKGEEQSGGRKKPSLLSNCYEAILAAIYIDSGIRKVYKVIKGHFLEYILTESVESLNRDYKSQLQEVSHKLFQTVPKYKVVKRSGPDHRQIFHVELLIDKDLKSKGKGSSKKEAQQNAAKKALERIEKCDTE